MGVKTNISWTSATWNPIRGCSRVSEGCRHCYAESVAYRFSGKGQPYEGLAVLKNGHASWTGEIEFVEEHLLDPIRWKKPRMIFVNSMSDLFHENVTDDMLDKIFAVMGLSPQHKFQCLTKRPERMLQYMQQASEEKEMQRRWRNAGSALVDLGALKSLTKNALFNEWEWPLPNVWLGVSTEDQKTADQRIPILLQTPAAIRFISAEPLLGPIDLNTNVGGTRWIGGQRGCMGKHEGAGTIECPHYLHHHHDDMCRKGLDWVIVGGESGPGARPCHLAWCSRLIVQCKMAKVAVFMKQLGGNIPDEDQDYIQRATGKSVHDRKGGNIEEFPLQLRVQEFPA